MDKAVDHLLVFKGNADIKDFPGNYTQYREWKDAQDQLERETETTVRTKQTPETLPKNKKEDSPKKKLSFKEKREFETLEQEIPTLEAEKADLETAMSSGTLSTEELLKKSDRMTILIDEIDEKTMRWLELSEWI